MRIRLQHKAFAGKSLLAPVQFSIEPGEFVALTGPSGAGKTTLLRILAGLDVDWQGEILEQDMAPVGLMFQEPRLMPWLTVLENLTLMNASRADALALLQRVGLGADSHKYPGQLSGGMQRRVALARALAMRPGLLLMDEPFSSLDQETAEACRGLLLDCWRETGTAVLFVTHDLVEAGRLAQRIWRLEGAPALLSGEGVQALSG